VRYTRRLFSLLLLAAIFLLIIPNAIAAEEPEDTGSAICIEDFMESAVGNKPRILYTGKTSGTLNMRSKPDRNAASLGVVSENKFVDIFGFDQQWLFCWNENVGVYYLLRHYVDYIEPVEEGIAPYGVIKNRFVAITAKDTALRTAPDENADVIEPYPANTRLSFWLIEDGWAVVAY